MARDKYHLQQRVILGKFGTLPKFFKKKIRILLITILVIPAIIIFNIYSDKSLSSYGEFIIIKCYYYASLPLHKLNTLWRNGALTISATIKNKELQTENSALKQQLLELETLRAQNKELKKVAHYINHSNFTHLTSNIVASSVDVLGAKLIINAGSKDGIRTGNAVVNNDGMVGRILDVSEYSARVLPINSGVLKIPVLLLKSGLHCIVGEPNSHGLLKILHKADKKKIPIIGEQAISSGEDGNIPFGIKIGTVELDTDKEMVLKSNVNFSNIGLISVLQSTNKE